jgi:hypothetical protein
VPALLLLFGGGNHFSSPPAAAIQRSIALGQGAIATYDFY